MTGAEVVLPCADLAATLSCFTEHLGFRVEVVFPADEPRVAVVSGHGTRVRLQTVAEDTWAEMASDVVVVPELEPSFTLTRAGDDWGEGRAGMQYRDLIPDRQGGRFIASHIRIPEGGPVPDWVHFHEIRFQLIVVRRGWVEVVYEDQGPPFVMEAGDCVLQPPRIRHRVLRAGDDLEVVEIGCPAEHRTVADHDLSLPTEALDPDRDFGGQRFVRHTSAGATWGAWRLPGFEARDTGIEDATGGLAGARFVRPGGPGPTPSTVHDAELAFTFVLAGSVTLTADGADHRLGPADSVVVPAGMSHSWCDAGDDLELLEVTMPARI